MTPKLPTKARQPPDGLDREPLEYRSTAAEETTDVFNRSVIPALRSQPAPWLLPATDTLFHLITLPEDWDSHGAARVSRNSVAAAGRILNGLSRIDTIQAPAISVDPEGNVAFSWAMRRSSLDAEVLPDGTVEYVYLDPENPGNDVEAETTDPSVLAVLLTRW